MIKTTQLKGYELKERLKRLSNIDESIDITIPTKYHDRQPKMTSKSRYDIETDMDMDSDYSSSYEEDMTLEEILLELELEDLLSDEK